MATRSTATEDGHARPNPRWAQEVAVSARAEALKGAVPQQLSIENGAQVWRPKAYPLPKPLTGVMPGVDRGAILAVDPNNVSSGDALFFEWYPTQLQESLGALVAAEDVPGRAMPVLQRMGGRGAKLSVELMFYDAFIYNPVYDKGPMPSGPRRDLAAIARNFFEVYVVGHDGTGAALPFAEMYLLWGGTQAPIRVMITDVNMTMEHFDVQGQPQSVIAKVDMLVYEPTYLIHPFKPKVKRVPGGKPKPIRCPSIPTTWKVLGITSDPIIDSKSNFDKTVAEATLAQLALFHLNIERVAGKASGFTPEMTGANK